MKESEINVIVGVVAIALVLYFGRPKKMLADGTGETGNTVIHYPEGGYGVGGSWLMMRPPLI